jgi:hypothetical protein
MVLSVQGLRFHSPERALFSDWSTAIFSLNKFSEEDAYLLAVTWREEQETRLRHPHRSGDRP